MRSALFIEVNGIVQGVGFRPFVYRLAHHYLITGWVLNAADGVKIHAEGEEGLLDEFVLAIRNQAPTAAKVERIKVTEVPLEPFDSFEIRVSDNDQTAETTLVSPDLATCDDCVRELFDPANRRYHYPFINCTNCGPRFTIIDGLPYDRPRTSMGAFAMCPSCAKEYADPSDRRFHAQPDACFSCGPHISWSEAGSDQVEWGLTREESDAIIQRAAAWLSDGKIVAVKGLGGFHLACDAENARTISELRRRKHREGKAFACLVATVDDARARCLVSAEEAHQLESPARPIVLLRKRPDATFAAGLADDLPELGVMLPATPVQHLLVRAFGGMMVMTSGNLHDEPIQTDDAETRMALAQVADAFLGNDRPIRARYDDSVIRVLQTGVAGDRQDTAVQSIRRARGYAPQPLSLPDAVQEKGASSRPIVFATGPEQKSTFCFARQKDAFVSQHIGDLENPAAFDAWLEAKRMHERLFELQAGQIVADRHPEYLSTKWAVRAQDEQGVPLDQVQHHHAHIVSAMAENNLEGPVCGIAFDGTGYGEDGAIWGGEVLLANLRTFERFANFSYVPMPGGAACVKHPLRMAYGVLWAFDLLDHPAAAEALAGLGTTADICGQMIERGLNTPMTSSVGRLFDAASALLGICTEPRYEGEGAVLLEAEMGSEADGGAREEAALDDDAQARYRIGILKNSATSESTALDTSVVLFDAAGTFAALLDDKQAGVEPAIIALRFHHAFVEAILQAAALVQAVYGIRQVVLAGGVFMNRYLIERCLAGLAQAGFVAAINRQLPPNDAGVSFGQAVVALARKTEESDA
ncbi:MAG: carbamoyltransferase HypF [Eggerthellaceae bacterium]|jgi:hydrogenase maturation protein HypF